MEKINTVVEEIFRGERKDDSESITGKIKGHFKQGLLENYNKRAF